MTQNGEVPLLGGWQTVVSRAGDVVYRSPKPQSATVMSLLRHLDEVGFRGAPRPVDGGFAPDGREQLTYVDGTSPHPAPWSDDAMYRLGTMVRELHDATAGFVAPDDAVWRPSFARALPGNRPVIGHGDLGPWNTLARDGLPTAFIDWDYAGPVDAIWELADAAWLNAQLHDDDVADLNDLGSPEHRAGQVRQLLDGYGLERAHRSGFVDRMIEMAVRGARQESIDYGVVEDTPSPAEDGFPLLWAVTWRMRAAAWMLDHRASLERALT